MTKVAILPETESTGSVTYRAIGAGRQSRGKTAGEALDSLTSSLSPEEAGTLVIVQNQRADEFFAADQQARLHELMGRWRAARDAGATFASAEQAELDRLVEAETRAAGKRAAAVLRELSQ